MGTDRAKDRRQVVRMKKERPIDCVHRGRRNALHDVVTLLQDDDVIVQSPTVWDYRDTLLAYARAAEQQAKACDGEGCVDAAIEAFLGGDERSLKTFAADVLEQAEDILANRMMERHRADDEETVPWEDVKRRLEASNEE